MSQIREHIQAWLNWLGVKQKLQTCRQYRWQLNALEKWGLSRTPPLSETATYTADQLGAYLAERRARVSDATIKVAVNALKNFFAYAAQRGWVSDDPAKLFEAPTVHAREQRTPTFEQVKAVLALCETTNITGLRNLALLTFMGSTGVRASEVCRLRLNDVDLQRRWFRVVVKGGREKKRRFAPSVAQVLGMWLAARPSVAAPECETVFCSTNPSPAGTQRGQTLSPDGLRVIFRRLAQKAGLENGFSPHDMRRFMATKSVELGAPTRLTQVNGGWERIGQVETYTLAVSLQDFDRFDPIEYLFGGTGVS